MSSLEEFLQSWGLLFEGPVRKTVRTKLADFLGVSGAQFPIANRFRFITLPRLRKIIIRG